MSEIRTCALCRYWSEMLAEARDGVVRAMCLSVNSPMARRWTSEKETCRAHQPGPAIDDPRAPKED